MLKESEAFGSFSVDDLAKAKKFYGETLGIKVTDDEMGLRLHLGAGAPVFVYPKDNHEPATFTVLNFPVDDIEETVDKLKEKGVQFEQVSFGEEASTDEKGIMRGRKAEQGPDIAWFKDPAGNFLSIMQLT